MTDSTNVQYTLGKDTRVTVLAKTETKISFTIKKKKKPREMKGQASERDR